jgi:serine/threonine protein kinase
MTQTLCGTPLYLAPEIYKDKLYYITSDLWSIGVILYELMYHNTPFINPKNIFELSQNIANMRIQFPANIDRDLKHLLKGLLQTNPYSRLDWD